MAVMDKKAIAAFGNKLKLHQLLIVEQDGVTSAHALAQAYHEGVEGVGKRLAGPAKP